MFAFGRTLCFSLCWANSFCFEFFFAQRVFSMVLCLVLSDLVEIFKTWTNFNWRRQMSCGPTIYIFEWAAAYLTHGSKSDGRRVWTIKQRCCAGSGDGSGGGRGATEVADRGGCGINEARTNRRQRRTDAEAGRGKGRPATAARLPECTGYSLLRCEYTSLYTHSLDGATVSCYKRVNIPVCGRRHTAVYAIVTDPIARRPHVYVLLGSIVMASSSECQ